MNTGAWVAIYMPLFIILFIILPQQNAVRTAVLRKMKKRKGGIMLTNDVIKKFVGFDCQISTGSFGTNVKGKIIDVNENWLEVETKKGKELINAEFVQSIKINKS